MTKPKRTPASDEIEIGHQTIDRPPRLRAEVERLVELKNVSALVSLYDAYVASAMAFMSLENQPRSGGTQKFLEDERVYAWGKAFYVAYRLKTLRPADREQYAATLFNCALAMGHNLDEASGIVNEINEQGCLRPAQS